MSAKRILHLIALLALVFGPACTITSALSPTATPPPTPTLVPSPTFTATPVPLPTDIPSPTATATPLPTDTPTATPVPQPGDTLLFDNFDDNTNGWDQYTRGNVKVAISGGALTMTVTGRNIFDFTSPSGSYTDVDLSADATLTKGAGSNSMFGLICRKVDNDNFYMATVAGDGYYGLFKYSSGNWKTLVDYTVSSAVKTGKVPNTLRLICSGQSLQFWVNGRRLITVKDKEFSEGGVGLVAGTFKGASPDTVVSFDNLSLKLAEPITSTGGGGGGTGGGGGGVVVTRPPAATASGTGQLILVMCQGIEATITIFHDGQIVQQVSLHNAGRNVYDLPPGHYDVQFSAAGYNNLNLAYDIVAGRAVTQYIGDQTC